MFARRQGERWGILLAFFLAHALLVAVLFRVVYTLGESSGTGVFYYAATRLFAGQVPYRDYVLEYPPVALVFFSLPRLAGPRFATYYDAFHAEIIAAQLAMLLLLAGFVWRRNASMTTILGAYTVFVLAVGPITIQQYDLFPAAITLGAIYAFTGGRYNWAAALLALGTLTKVYPLLLAPLFLLPLWRAGERRAIRAGIIVFVATTIIALSPLLLIAPTALRSFLAYHADRGIQIESTYASLVLVADKFGLSHAGMRVTAGAWDVTGALPDVLAPLSTLVLAAAVTWALYTAYGALQRGRATDTDFIITASLLVLTCGLLSSKVLSPQYLIWLLPLVPLVPTGMRRSVWPLFVLIGVVTYYIFPTAYDRLIYHDDGFVILMLVIRNAMLGALAWLLARELGRAPVAVGSVAE